MLRPDLPGKLSFRFDASGAPFGERAALDRLRSTSLAGKLRGQDAAGKGQLSRAAGNDAGSSDGVDVRFGRTQMQLDGGLGSTRDLQFRVDAEDLSLLDPEARGSSSARGRFAGTRQRRCCCSRRRAPDFEWQGTALD